MLLNRLRGTCDDDHVKRAPDGVLFQVRNLHLGAYQLLGLAGVVVFFLVALKLSQAYWNRRLTEWAQAQGLQLVSFRGARIYEGPSAWIRSQHQQVFRVVVRDRKGQERSGWMMFGTYWGFTWGIPLKEVIWDDQPEL